MARRRTAGGSRFEYLVQGSFDPGTLARYPQTPGVYFMRNARREIIYVGKAVNLRKRLQSYFRPSSQRDRKVFELAMQVERIDILQYGSDLEALLMEARFIQELQPIYNRQIKNYKKLCYLKIRQVSGIAVLEAAFDIEPETDAAYFGPFTSQARLDGVLAVASHVFGLKSCDPVTYRKYEKLASPCIKHALGQCSAPCADRIAPEDYQALVGDFIRFVKTGESETIERLYRERDAAIEALAFEKAGKIQHKLHKVDVLKMAGNRIAKAIEDYNGFIVQPDLKPGHARLIPVLGGVPMDLVSVSRADGVILAGWVDMLYGMAAYQENRRGMTITKTGYEQVKIICLWLSRDAHSENVTLIDEMDRAACLSRLSNQIARVISRQPF